jgi:phytoene dehydrogenase-like protein
VTANRRDVVIVGGGHNGLVAAAYLAKAGHSPLVLERREIVGGSAVTEEFAPGFRASTLAQWGGSFQEGIARDLGLARHGLESLRPPIRLFAPGDGGRAVRVYADPLRTAQELSGSLPRDAARWVELHESLVRIAGLLAPLLSQTPPPLEGPGPGDLWKLLGLGRRFRALPKKDAYRLLRWGPMAVADLASEWFESERLRALVAARGIYGMFAGPWSAGTSANLLLRAAASRSAGLIAAGTSVKGGLGALTRALAAAARSFGAEIRTGAEVARITAAGGEATGVVLSNGEEIPARAVLSNADPKRTFLGLLDPMHLDPDFLGRVRNYRSFGVAARVHYALGALPRFTGAETADLAASLSGAIHVGPDVDYLERAFDAAKYGGFSPEPYLEAAIPTLLDPDLAPPGRHVLSVYVQYAPYELKDQDWSTARESFAEAVTAALSRWAPDLPRLVLHRSVITPRDLERDYGLTGGHPFHGEHSLDQLFASRPVLGWARYRTPVRGLYLCGAGTHPGGGVTGVCGANASREVIKDLRRRYRPQRQTAAS